MPVKITYDSPDPMIPLRLTAVAANPDMSVLTWFFANDQAVPTNYTHMQIPTDDLRFFIWGGNNYRSLIGTTADRFNGQAFVTEYAGPTNNFAFTDPLLLELAQKHRYLTRLNTVISPEEMTIDPVFGYDPNRDDVSNVRDLSDYEKDLYDCDRDPNFQPANVDSGSEESGGSTINIPFFGNGGNDSQGNDNSSGSGSANDANDSGSFRNLILLIVLIGFVLGIFVVILAGILMIRRSMR
jgi:hypothetical protein